VPFCATQFPRDLRSRHPLFAKGDDHQALVLPDPWYLERATTEAPSEFRGNVRPDDAL